MSDTNIEAGLRLKIAEYQQGLAQAKAEAQKFKADLTAKGADLDKKLFEAVEKHKLDLSRARKDVEDMRALFKAKGDRLEKDFFEKFEKHKLDLSNLQSQLKRLKDSQGGGLGDIVKGVVGGNLLTRGIQQATGFMEDAIRRGLEFNMTMNNSEVGIANLLKRFDGLNASAAKDEAARAMRRIVELEPVTAGSLQDLTLGFMKSLAAAKGVGFTTEQNVQMTAKFANAVANAGMSLEQLGQEYKSILTSTITKDSQIAKILGITNEDVNAIKARGGDLFKFLDEKLGEMGNAGDSAGVAMSSFQSALDKTAGAITSGMFDVGINDLKELTQYLDANREGFRQFGKDAGTGLELVVDMLKAAKDAASPLLDLWVALGHAMGEFQMGSEAYKQFLDANKLAGQQSRQAEEQQAKRDQAAKIKADEQAKLQKEMAAQQLDNINMKRAKVGLPALTSLPGAASGEEGSSESSGNGGGGSGGKKSVENKIAEEEKRDAYNRADMAGKIKMKRSEVEEAHKFVTGGTPEEKLEYKLKEARAQRELNELLKQQAKQEENAKAKTARLREQLQSKKDQAVYDQADTVGKIGIKQKEVQAQEAKVKGADTKDKRLEEGIKLAELQRELNDLTKQQAENISRVKEKMEVERQSFIDKLEKQKQAKESLREELAIADAKARGDEAAVQAMEKEMEIRKKAKEIHEAIGGDPRMARMAAEQLINPAKGKLTKGGHHKREDVRDDGAHYIRGVQKKHKWGSALDEHHARQKREGNAATAMGHSGLSARGRYAVNDSGMLSQRHSQNAGKADAAEMAARSDRDPNTNLLSSMLKLWQEQLAT